MTIKEVAVLANVSVSTVSKIINKNDESISSATRERVLKVIKEYNYEPYSNVKVNKSNSPFLIGIVIDGRAGHESLLLNLISEVRRCGYTAMVSITYSKEEEYNNLVLLSSYNVKGILWDRTEGSSKECEAYLEKEKIAYQTIDFHNYSETEGFHIDYRRLGSQMTDYFMDHKHRKLIFLKDPDNAKSDFCVEGFKASMFEHNVPFLDEMIRDWSADRSQMSSLLHRVTGILCSNRKVTSLVCDLAGSMNLNIPKDLSVICLEEGEEAGGNSLGISSPVIPYRKIAEEVVHRLVDIVEGRGIVEGWSDLSFYLSHTESIDVPYTIRNKKIVVVGTINMDTIIRFGKLPEGGETVTANTRVLCPGGKGMNQAVAASRLGAEVYLIGKLGKDYDGSILHDYLKDNNVNIEGVSGIENADTGHAYIYVQEDGESSIAVYNGANQYLSVEDIRKHAAIFENASYCLVQTEISLEIIEYVVKMAARHQVKVILKPAAISEIGDEIVKYVDILMPNKKEINRLLPDIPTYEEKAQYYLDRGVKNVIITLGHKGCYFRNRDNSQYYNAFDVVPLDTTGAADAFSAALGFYLSKDNSMDEAIKRATIVAGVSTTRPGAAPSMPDKDTLDMLMASLL